MRHGKTWYKWREHHKEREILGIEVTTYMILKLGTGQIDREISHQQQYLG